MRSTLGTIRSLDKHSVPYIHQKVPYLTYSESNGKKRLFQKSLIWLISQNWRLPLFGVSTVVCFPKISQQPNSKAMNSFLALWMSKKLKSMNQASFTVICQRALPDFLTIWRGYIFCVTPERVSWCVTYFRIFSQFMKYSDRPKKDPFWEACITI